MSDFIPRIVIAAPQSGSGKTTITVGLIAALVRRGHFVQPFKVGPDYIDPTYHALAAGRACRNLDSWMLPNGRWQEVFKRAIQDASLAMIEGVMGLYDGASYDSETGSTAEIAKQLDAPVVVVIDAAKMARSIGAIALGLMNFDPSLKICGFIANNVGSESHGQGVAKVIETTTGKPCFGWIPRQSELSVPERRLGLLPATHPAKSQAFIDTACAAVERYIDVDALLHATSSTFPVRPTQSHRRSRKPDRDRVVIAVARDEAFSFIYPENLELLEEAGAHLAFFSPLRDNALPPGTSGVILSGGFPESYAAKLSANTDLHIALKDAHAKNLPIFAECGGLMYLTQAIRETDGTTWPMVALLQGISVMTAKLTLGYRLAEAAADGPLLAAGEKVRGHEFHYSVWDDRPADLQPAFILHPPRGGNSPSQTEGACLGNLWATYVHTHFLHTPSMASRFVAACRAAG